MTPSGDPTDQVQQLLRRELAALLDVVRPWGQARWEAAGRSATAAQLADELATLGYAAGAGSPAGVVPGRVRVHGLADQLTVLGRDLTDAGPDEASARAALRAIRAARAALVGAPAPGDAARAAGGGAPSGGGA